MAFAFVQGAQTSPFSGTGRSTDTLAYGSNVTKNNLLVVVVGYQGTLNSIQDTVATSWTRLIHNTSGNLTLDVYYGAAGASGANTVQANYTSGTFTGVGIAEFSGFTGGIIAGTPVTTAHVSPITVSSYSNTASNALLFGLGAVNLAVYTYDAAYTNSWSTASVCYGGYKLNVASGTYSTTFSDTSGASIGGALVGFSTNASPSTTANYELLLGI